MLIIGGWVRVEPGRRDEYVAALTDLVRRARRAPGALDVAITADPLDPGRVNTFERWESREDVERWRAVAHAPDPGVAVLDADVRMWDATRERDPFDPT